MRKPPIKLKKRTDLKTLDPLYIHPEAIDCILKADRAISQIITEVSAILNKRKSR